MNKRHFRLFLLSLSFPALIGASDPCDGRFLFLTILYGVPSDSVELYRRATDEVLGGTAKISPVEGHSNGYWFDPDHPLAQERSLQEAKADLLRFLIEEEIPVVDGHGHKWIIFMDSYRAKKESLEKAREEFLKAKAHHESIVQEIETQGSSRPLAEGVLRKKREAYLNEREGFTYSLAYQYDVSLGSDVVVDLQNEDAIELRKIIEELEREFDDQKLQEIDEVFERLQYNEMIEITP